MPEKEHPMNALVKGRFFRFLVGTSDPNLATGISHYLNRRGLDEVPFITDDVERYLRSYFEPSQVDNCISQINSAYLRIFNFGEGQSDDSGDTPILRVGAKVTDRQRLLEAVDVNLRASSQESYDMVVYNYWRSQLPASPWKSTLERGKEVGSKIKDEVLFAGSLIVMSTGRVLEEVVRDRKGDDNHSGKSLGHIRNRALQLAIGLMQTPVWMQMAKDFGSVISNEKLGPEDLMQRVEEISRYYGIPLEENVFFHNPQLINNIVKSALYGEFLANRWRDIVGWGTYLALLASPQYTNVVKSVGALETSAIAATILAAATYLRVLADKTTLETLGWNSSFSQTTANAITAKVDGNGNLKMDPAGWSKIEVARDIMMSFLPPYIFAMFAKLPVSASAYIFAVCVDQASFVISDVTLVAANKLNLARARHNLFGSR